MNGDLVINCDSEVGSVAFPSSGNELAGLCRDANIRFWDPATGALRRAIPWSKEDMRGAAFSENATLMAASGPEKVIKVWDVKNGEMRQRLAALPYAPGSLAISRDGKLLASNAGIERAVRLWDLATGSQLFVLPDGLDGSDLLFSPDGQVLVAANSDTNVRIWNTSNGRLLKAIEDLPVTMFALSFSPDGRQLAAAGADRVVHVWETASWKELRMLKGQPEMISAMAFSGDGKRLVTGGFDDVTSKNPTSVLLWDVTTGAVIRKMPSARQVSSVALSSDGRTIAVASSQKTVQLWHTV